MPDPGAPQDAHEQRITGAVHTLEKRLVLQPARVLRRQGLAVLGLRIPKIALFAAIGPGLVSGFADNDAGGITTYSIAGARFGYGLMWALLASMIALGFTQEIGARLGLATGKGLLELIRERYGVRLAVFAIAVMLLANLGTTVAEFAGIGAALSIVGVPVPISALMAATVAAIFLVKGNFNRIQLVFLVLGAGISLSYAMSAYLAHPDWGLALHDTFIPKINLSSAYLLALLATVGTTITPWGQAFIQSYTADKQLTQTDLRASRLDITVGALVTNTVAAFILIACAATLFATHQDVTDAAQAANALAPLAGASAKYLFAGGLLAASLLGLGVVPLTSAYAAAEALGFERGLDRRWREAPAFYTLLSMFIFIGAAVILIPGLPLFQLAFVTQAFGGVLLPIILVFVMLMSRDRRLLGDLVSGKFLQFAGWTVVVAVSVLSLAYIISTFLPTS